MSSLLGAYIRRIGLGLGDCGVVRSHPAEVAKRVGGIVPESTSEPGDLSRARDARSPESDRVGTEGVTQNGHSAAADRISWFGLTRSFLGHATTSKERRIVHIEHLAL